MCEGGMPAVRLLRRCGIPFSTWYYRRSFELAGRPVKRWPTPARDAIEEPAAELAKRHSAWGHCKIWAMLPDDGVRVSCSSVARATKRCDMLLPVRYRRERRALPAARKAVFATPPVRRNRVWQMEFAEFETICEDTWRICCVVDYAAKCVLAAHLSAITKGRDAVEALKVAIARAEELLCHTLAGDCVDLESGEMERLCVVTDNGAAFKSDAFWRFITRLPYLEHIRVRHCAAETIGIVERFNQSLRCEHLCQREIELAPVFADEVDSFVITCNEVGPHETLGQRTPLPMHREDPHP